MDPYSSPASSLQLAMAALVGASLMAISAFYIHKRSVDQILNRLIELRECRLNTREPSETEEDEEKEKEEQDEDGVDSDREIERRMWKQNVSSSLNDHRPYYYRVSSSMPNVMLANDWMNDESRFDQPVPITPASSLDKLNMIPSGLSRLQTTPRDGTISSFGFIIIFLN